MTNEKKCEYCDKRGVPILPLRYGVAPAGSHLPKAVAPGVDLPGQAAYYTHRLLRTGYLYVYDEARHRWDSYFVTPQAMFFKIHSSPGGPQILPKKPFDCPDQGHRALASCITIPDARNATNVWLGFSDVEWTAAVRQKHQDGTYRQRHMRCVDIRSFAASKDKAHALGMHLVPQQVAEYAIERNQLQQALKSSPFDIDPRKDHAARLIRESENLAPGKGFAVTLDDPVAIAAELDGLMNQYLAQFNSPPDRKRKLAVDAALTQIEQAVREQARVSEERAAEQLAGQMMSQPDLGVLFSRSYARRKAAQHESMRTVTEAQATHAGDQAWKKYTDKYHWQAARNWRKQYDQDLQHHDAQFIAPLAEAHAALMRSDSMHGHFDCNHDPADPRSGIVYPKTLQLCIGSTQDKAACFDLYHQWMAGNLDDRKNLLLSAMALNLDKTREEVQKAMTVSLDWRGFPFDALMGGFGEATKSVAEGKADAVGRLLAQVFGPMAKLMNAAIDGKVRAGLVAVGLYTQKTFAVVTVRGRAQDFRAALIRDVIKLSGQPLNENRIKMAVRMELKRLGMGGMDLSQPENKKFLVMIDPQHLKTMPANLTRAQQSAWVVQAIKTSAQFEELQLTHLNKWQGQVRNPTNTVIKNGIPYVTALVVAALQYNAYQKLSEDEGKAMSHEKSEAQKRLWAGSAALIGTISESVGMGAGRLAAYVPKFAQGWLNYGVVFLKALGKSLSLIGAIIMASMDFKQAQQAKAQGQTGLVWVYRLSALGGVLAAVAFFVGWTGVGLVLVAALFIIALVIEYFKDNKVQDWLERCVWGKGPESSYGTLEEEIQQLKTATSD